MTNKIENLDLQCATFAQKMADKAQEPTIGKALGVLQEDGIYACFLYLLSQNEKGGANYIVKNASELLKLGTDPVNAANLPTKLENVVNNLDQLFFAKELLERTLIYARYHAKARESPPQGDRS